MGNSVNKHHYETAKKTGALNLSNHSLDEFPSKLKDLSPTLRQLNLSNNKFRQLPSHIANYHCLKLLNVDNNRLSALPDDIGQLIKLETLSAASNTIASLPSSLSLLANLKEIDFHNNQISEFPAGLCELKHLNIINLSKNRITAIPDCVGRSNITELNLNENNIRTISPEIANAPRLKILKLDSNQLILTGIPKQLLTNSKVSSLTAENNLFSMKELEQTDEYEKYMERYTEIKKKMF